MEFNAGGSKIHNILAGLVQAAGGDVGSIVRFVDGGTFVVEATHGPAILGLKARVPAISSINFCTAAKGEFFGTYDYGALKLVDGPLDRLALTAGIRSTCTVPLMIGASTVAALTISSFQSSWDYPSAIQKVVEVGHRLVLELVRDTDQSVSSRLFVCHDDALSAEGLARFGELELGIKDVVIAPAIDDVADAVQSSSDLVVTDCYVGGKSLDRQVQALSAANLFPRVLVIASRDTEINRAAAARANVYGYCPKDAGRQVIVDAFLRAGSGLFSPPMFNGNVIPYHGLTPREREVLLLLDQGLQVKHVASMLKIAQPTVKCYIRNIFAKLDVHSTTRALYVARDNGLLEPIPLS